MTKSRLQPRAIGLLNWAGCRSSGFRHPGPHWGSYWGAEGLPQYVEGELGAESRESCIADQMWLLASDELSESRSHLAHDTWRMHRNHRSRVGLIVGRHE